MTSIYGLFDPRNPEIIWYVGKGPVKRACSHWRAFLRRQFAQNAKQRRWFEKLRAEGVEPSWRFLEENVVDWETAERKWIAYWREKNPDLCNVADGGNAWPLWSGHVGDRVGKAIGGRNVPMADRIRGGQIGNREGKARGARRRFELYGNTFTPEICKTAGVLGGKASAEWRKNNPEQAAINLSAAGKVGGAIGGKSRSLKKTASSRVNADFGRHIRWHVNRGVINPECQLCRPDFFDIWEGGNA